MNKSVLSLLACIVSQLIASDAELSLCGPLPSTAAPEQIEKRTFCSRVQIGANYTYVSIHPNGQTSTSGSLGGVQALYEFKTTDHLYGGLTFAFRDGNTSDSGTERSLMMFDVQERIGYTNCWRKCAYTFFTGFGYRHYGEDLETNNNELLFDYNEFYVPVGFLTSYRMYSDFSVGLNFTWMPQVYPTVTIDPLKGARWIITTQLANFRVEVPFSFVVCRKHHLSLCIQPFFECWKDGHSTATTPSGLTLGIPEITYLFGGVDVNLRYSF